MSTYRRGPMVIPVAEPRPDGSWWVEEDEGIAESCPPSDGEGSSNWKYAENPRFGDDIPE